MSGNARLSATDAPQTYSAISVASCRERAELLASVLERIDPQPTCIGTTEIEDGSGCWEVGAYFGAMPDNSELALLSSAFGATDFTISEIPEIDWVSKVQRDLKPVRVGRFWVHGSHLRDAVPEDVIPLEIESSMAFGTGHHPTTAGCLSVLDDFAREEREFAAIADIGCGTGVLAMASARLWSGVVVATDIDPVAIDVAAANFAANSLSGKIELHRAAGFQHPVHRCAGPYDLALANLHMDPLLELAAEFSESVREGGMAVLSGLLETQAHEVANAYRNRGFRLIDSRKGNEWETVVFRKVNSNRRANRCARLG